MREYLVIKFECGTLRQLISKVISVEGNVDRARKEGERILKLQPNQFVAAELLPET